MAANPSVKNGSYQKTILKNGLRVVSEYIPSVRSISLGVWVDVGSRNEPSNINGASHLIEHMLFKGTKNRNAKEIASSLESIGGSLNAFTSKEQTCYTARILDEHLDVAIDVLSDITGNATFTPTNLLREKKVILEEISESLETPSDHIHDIFAETYWGKNSLGRPILGTNDSVLKMPRSQLLSYMKNNYRSESIVIAASGNVSHMKLVKLVKDKFNFPEGSKIDCEQAYRDKQKKVFVKKNEYNQIHLCLGYPALAYNDREKMTALAIHTYLGGGMSSALFQKIREQKGMAYTVYTYLDFYRDAGIFGTYLATDKQNLKSALDLTLKEFEKIKKNKIPDAKLDLIKAQLKGHLTLGMESTSNRMNRLARNEIMSEGYQPIRKTLNKIDKVNSSSFLETVNRIFDNSKIAVAVLGGVEAKDINDVV